MVIWPLLHVTVAGNIRSVTREGLTSLDAKVTFVPISQAFKTRDDRGQDSA